MRTKTQIENLRRAFLMMPYGAYAILMTDGEIDAMADRLQSRINSIHQHTWTVFTKIEGEDIFREEPVRVKASLDSVSQACKDLLSKYSRLSCIRIRNEENYIYTFSRKGERVESQP